MNSQIAWTITQNQTLIGLKQATPINNSSSTSQRESSTRTERKISVHQNQQVYRDHGICGVIQGSVRIAFFGVLYVHYVWRTLKVQGNGDGLGHGSFERPALVSFSLRGKQNWEQNCSQK